MVYALLNDGSVVGVNYPNGTFYAAGTSLLGAYSTDSAPIVTEIAPDPAFYSPVRNLTSVAQSVPALVFGDSDGGLYGFKLVSESNQDSTNPVNILPIIYARLDTSGQLAAPPALAASNFTSKIGGYYVVGDTNGQLRAYSFGFGQYGDIETVPNTEGTGNGFIAGDVSIDVRIADAYAKADYDQMAQIWNRLRHGQNIGAYANGRRVYRSNGHAPAQQPQRERHVLLRAGSGQRTLPGRVRRLPRAAGCGQRSQWRRENRHRAAHNQGYVYPSPGRWPCP